MKRPKISEIEKEISEPLSILNRYAGELEKYIDHLESKQKVESVSKHRIRNHYKKFFDIIGKGFTMDEDDELMIDWAEYLIKDLTQTQTQIPLLPSDEEIRIKVKEILANYHDNAIKNNWCSSDISKYIKSQIKGIPKELTREEMRKILPNEDYYTESYRGRITMDWHKIINHFLNQKK